MTILHHAAFEGNLEIVKILKQELNFFGDIVDDSSNESGWTPLTLAAQTANFEIA